jgi:hypothetical protein
MRQTTNNNIVQVYKRKVCTYRETCELTLPTPLKLGALFVLSCIGDEMEETGVYSFIIPLC